MNTHEDDELRGYTIQELASSVIYDHRARRDVAVCDCGWKWDEAFPAFLHSAHVADALLAAALLA